MAQSAAEYFEVRWRIKGSGEAWAGPRRIAPTSEIVVTELDRTKLYEFEVRSASACGAKSVWVPSDYTVPGAVPPTSIDTLTTQSLADGVHLGWTSIATPAAGIESSIERSPDGSTGWAERARVRSTAYTDPETSGATYYYRVRYVNFAGQFGAYSPVVSSNGVNVGGIGTNASNALADAAAAQADADAANAALADIASDNLLTPGEKPVVIRDTNVIVAEQPGIDAQATAYGITTQKTAYDTAVSALTSYLATLTAPVLWSNLTGNTTIVGATFRSKFADVYTTRQALLNAIYAAAKSKADAAQGAADAAAVTANNAQPAAIVNPGFEQGMYGWTPDTGMTKWYAETGTNGPNGGASSYVVHGPGDGNPTGYLVNAFQAPCDAGQIIRASCRIRGLGANGNAAVRLLWRNSAGGNISSSVGNFITGSTTGVSSVVGTAPAGTAFVSIGPGVGGHTTLYYAFDDMSWNYQPRNVGEVPDGGGRYAVHQVDSNGLALIDFTQAGHASKNLDNIGNGSIYARSSNTAAAGSQLAIDNNTLQLPAEAGGTIPGWDAYATGAILVYQSVSPAPAIGSQYLSVYAGVATGGARGRQKYRPNPGDSVTLQATLNAISGTSASVALTFWNASGGFIGQVAVTTASATWQTLMASGQVPAGTAYAYLFAQVSEIGYVLLNSVTVTINDVRVAGSGARLGDMRNQVMVGVGNYGAGWSGGSISYSATTTSATITAAAATLQVGSTTLAYNSANVTVSGSAGLVQTYYLYYDDDGYTGGSKTLNATTSQITSLAANGRILVGQVAVTFPTSGTGGGSGGTGCPVRTARVVRRTLGGEEEVAAGDVAVGDRLKIIDPVTGATRWGLVTMSRPAYVDCVRVVQQGGIVLSCSSTAPLGCSDGVAILAPHSLGRAVTGLDAGALVHAEIVHVASIGKRWVQHITCEDDFFLAGDRSGRYLAHHNLKPP